MNNIIFTIGLFLAAGVLAGFQASAQELRVVSSDAGGITIEYAPVIEESKVMTEQGEFMRLSFEGAVMDEPLTPGAPDVRFRRELLGLPGAVGNTVSVIQADYKVQPGTRLAPVPFLRKAEDGEGTIRVYETGDSYNNASLYPQSIAQLRNVSLAGDMILGSLDIYPVQYNAAGSTARIYTKIVVRVNYGPRAAARTKSGTSSFIAGTDLLNNATAANYTLQPDQRLQKTGSTNINTGDWYRIEVTEEGFYKLDKQWFDNAGINTSSLDPRTIKLFTNGAKELEHQNLEYDPMDGFQEMAVQVVGESDGRFDDGDYVLFYGKGISGWEYSGFSQTYRHYQHRYAFANSYLLTFAGAQGKRVAAKPSLDEPNAVRPGSFIARTFVENELINYYGSGKLWVGKKLVPGLGGGGNAVTYTKQLPGIVQGGEVTYRMRLFSQAGRGVSNYFTITDNGQSVGNVNMGTINLNDETGPLADPETAELKHSATFPEERSVVTLAYFASNNEQALGANVDWVEWHYPRLFSARNDFLFFSAPVTGAVVEYSVDNFGMSDIRVWDVTEHANPEVVTNARVNVSRITFQAEEEENKPSEYAAAAATAFRTPAGVQKIGNSSLLSEQGAEFIIITHDEFLDAANRLKQHRERPGSDYMSTRVVSLGDIYYQFNCGVTDPTAIRNFLGYAFVNWEPQPKYVLLLGDGHFDYKGHISQETIRVPAWETEESIIKIETYVTDDFYVQVAGIDTNTNRFTYQADVRVDMACGRLPAGTANEAETLVDKIISYETNQDFGTWRTTTTFVADDQYTTDPFPEYFHTSQAESIATNEIEEVFEREKIYAAVYNTEITAQGNRKPEAAKAIIDRINAGSLTTGYTGHGSSEVWSHESILQANISIPQLTNARRLTFLTAATCTFGIYDVPDAKSGTERMLLKPDGGAIGSLTAPRLVYAGENYNFGRVFYEKLLLDGREFDGRARRIGDAIYRTKQIHADTPGYEKHHILGDPTVRLLIPPYVVGLESVSINGEVVQEDTVQLKALSKVTLSGSVRRFDSTLIEDFNGTSEVALYDADQIIALPDFPDAGFNSYKTRGGLLYRGQATVLNGRFSVTFIIPKDISYENLTGRMSFYVDNQSIDGAGVFNSFVVGGSDTSGIADDEGPRIELFMDSRSFKTGDLVNENSLMIADLFDDHGINTTGLGIGHNIEAWLDDEEESTILNQYYRGKQDSYQEGTVEFLYEDLAPGVHTLKLRAWDIFNNSATAEILFNVESSTELSIANLYNVPNPMEDETVFTFQHNQSQPIDAEIKIYSLGGRLIHEIERRNLAERFVRIAWDGRDMDGDQLANGIYFYKVVLRTLDGTRGSERIGKLSVLR